MSAFTCAMGIKKKKKKKLCSNLSEQRGWQADIISPGVWALCCGWRIRGSGRRGDAVLVEVRWMAGRKDGWLDGWMDGWIDREEGRADSRRGGVADCTLMPSCSWFEITSVCVSIQSEHTRPKYTSEKTHTVHTQRKKRKKHTRRHTLTHLSDKTALHQGSLLTSLRPVKSRLKILQLLMPAGSLVNGAPCAYTLCLIEQARTVMVDKEGHFISGSSLILMKTGHLWGHTDIL